MANVYEAAHSNGQKYDVTTDKHHADHSDADFKKHLLGAIERAIGGGVGGLISGYILHYTLKKRG